MQGEMKIKFYPKFNAFNSFLIKEMYEMLIQQINTLIHCNRKMISNISNDMKLFKL